MALSDYFKAHKSLGASDRRIIGETVFGMIRWKSLIDALTSSNDPAQRLRHFQNIDWSKLQSDSSIPEYARLGTSDFLFSTFCQAFGAEKGRHICQILNEQAPLTVRSNLLKTTREELIALWKDKFSLSTCPRTPCGIRLNKREPLFSLPEFKEGLFEVQDEGSQLVASLIEPLPGDHILDFCSGSGGKTLAFAPSMEKKGQIFLHDIRPQALLEARRRLKRAGIQNAQCLSPGHSQLKRLINKCDWVLADVPCSGTGTLRRNPDQKWKIDAPMVERLIIQQKEIFQEALKYVKINGRIVYATCSILPEENKLQVQHFLENFPVVLEKEPLFLLPESGGCDGFYAAVFRKKSI